MGDGSVLTTVLQCFTVKLFLNGILCFRTKLRHLTRWFNTVIHQDNVIAVIGEVKLCEKEAEVVMKRL